MIADWPIAAGLRALRSRLRHDAARAYSNRLLFWATQVGPVKRPGRPPQPPALLQGE